MKRVGGFTLIEIVIVILLIGILLPAVLMPFVTAAGSAGKPVSLASLSLVARGELEKEMYYLDNYWPLPGYFPKAAVAETVGGREYSTTVDGYFVDSNFAETDGTPTNNLYLWVTVTTTETLSGRSVSISALNSMGYRR